MSITRSNKIKCDGCGKWVKYEDIAKNKAVNKLVYPDSDLTRETWESLCARCYNKENVNANR